MLLVIFVAGWMAVRDFTSKKTTGEPKKKGVIERVVKKVEKPKPKPDVTLAEIEKYLESQVGEYGYSIVEIETGTEYGNRVANSYVAASTVKVAVASYIYSLIEAGQTSPEKILTYTSADYEGGTGSLQAYKIGTKFKVSFLIERMISVSDNVATNILIRSYGRSNIQAFLNKKGFSEIVMVKNTVTPGVMTKLLAAIERGEVIGVENKAELIEYMKGSITPTRLVAGVPTSVEVAHKIGTQSQAISDIGIVYFEGHPYAIAVYSRLITSVPDAEATIKYISKKVYGYESTR